MIDALFDGDIFDSDIFDTGDTQPGGGRRPRRMRGIPSGFGPGPERETRRRPDNDDEALILLLD